MFTTTIKKAIPVPKRDFYLLSGDSPVNELTIGCTLTDGINEYEVLSIPFIHRTTDEIIDMTDFILKPGNYKPMDLIGKTLYAV